MVENNLGERLKSERKRRGITQEELANILKISGDYISKIEKGQREPSPIVADKIVDYLRGPHIETNAKTNLVPVYGTVPAGWPNDVIDGEILGWIPVEGSTHGLAGLKVEGHSMSPEIRDGDYVLYKEDYELRSGDIIIATNEFNSAMVKKYALKDGEPWLVSINPEYPAFKVNDHYRIIGRVIERISKEKIGRQ